MDQKSPNGSLSAEIKTCFVEGKYLVLWGGGVE